jgi:hypothetical protein
VFSSLFIKYESFLLGCVVSVYVFAVFPGNTKIPVFLGFFESCVHVISFYLAVFPRNIKIPVCLGLSECCVYLISFHVPVFLRNTKIPVSLILADLLQPTC